MKNDLKTLLLALFIGGSMVIYTPTSFKEWFSENLMLEIDEFDQINEYQQENRERLDNISAFIRNEELNNIVLGSRVSLSQLEEKKMEDAGLVYDKEGTVIKEEDLGKLKAPYSFLIIGSSSMLEGLGPRMEYDLEQVDDMTVFRHGKYSSGLTRPDFYNWNVAARQDIAKYQPQAIIVQFGGNDGQTIDGVPYATNGWDEIYTKRVETFIKAISSVEKIYWIELPIAGSSAFTEKFIRINRIQKEVVEGYANVKYIECWDRFAPEGKFEQYLYDIDGIRGSVKASDGVHLTSFGSKILSDIVMTDIKEDLN